MCLRFKFFRRTGVFLQALNHLPFIWTILWLHRFSLLCGCTGRSLMPLRQTTMTTSPSVRTSARPRSCCHYRLHMHGQLLRHEPSPEKIFFFFSKPTYCFFTLFIFCSVSWLLYIISFSCLHGISLACHTQFLLLSSGDWFHVPQYKVSSCYDKEWELEFDKTCLLWITDLCAFIFRIQAHQLD